MTVVGSAGGWDGIQASIGRFSWSGLGDGERRLRTLSCGGADALFERLVQGTTRAGRALLMQVGSAVAAAFPGPGGVSVYEYVYRSFLAQLARRRLVHGGLVGGEELLAARVERMLLAAATEGFPTFCEDEGIVAALCCAGHFVPLHTYHAQLTAVPRGLLWSVPWRETLRVAAYLAVELEGTRPVLEIHLPKLKAGRLLVEDYVNEHRRLARLLSSNRAVRGLYNSSWYYDPAVRGLSPHLGFLSEFASANGSLLVRVGSDPSSVQDATLKSAKRRAAYEAGTYVPTRYARLWSRRRLLAWAGADAGRGA